MEKRREGKNKTQISMGNYFRMKTGYQKKRRRETGMKRIQWLIEEKKEVKYVL